MQAGYLVSTTAGGRDIAMATPIDTTNMPTIDTMVGTTLNTRYSIATANIGGK